MGKLLCAKCPRIKKQASDGKYRLIQEGDETPARKDTPESHKDSGWQCNRCYNEWVTKGKPVKAPAGGQVPVVAAQDALPAPKNAPHFSPLNMHGSARASHSPAGRRSLDIIDTFRSPLRRASSPNPRSSPHGAPARQVPKASLRSPPRRALPSFSEFFQEKSASADAASGKGSKAGARLRGSLDSPMGLGSPGQKKAAEIAEAWRKSEDDAAARESAEEEAASRKKEKAVAHLCTSRV